MQAYDYTEVTLGELLELCNSWKAPDFDEDENMCRECQGSVRQLYVVGMKMVENFDLPPLLFSKIDVPGVKDRIWAHWQACEPSKHDRITRGVFQNPQLLDDFHAIQPDGTGASDALLRVKLAMETTALFSIKKSRSKSRAS